MMYASRVLIIVKKNLLLVLILQFYYEDRSLLETRGAMVIRKLCSLLDSSSIYMNLARILNTKTDLVNNNPCFY